MDDIELLRRELAVTTTNLNEVVDEVSFCEQQLSTQRKQLLTLSGCVQDAVSAGRDALLECRVSVLSMVAADEESKAPDLSSMTTTDSTSLSAALVLATDAFVSRITSLRSRAAGVGVELDVGPVGRSDGATTDAIATAMSTVDSSVVRALRLALVEQREAFDKERRSMVHNHEQSVGTLAVELKAPLKEERERNSRLEAEAQQLRDHNAALEHTLDLEIRRRHALEAQIRYLKRECGYKDDVLPSGAGTGAGTSTGVSDDSDHSPTRRSTGPTPQTQPQPQPPRQSRSVSPSRRSRTPSPTRPGDGDGVQSTVRPFDRRVTSLPLSMGSWASSPIVPSSVSPIPQPDTPTVDGPDSDDDGDTGHHPRVPSDTSSPAMIVPGAEFDVAALQVALSKEQALVEGLKARLRALQAQAGDRDREMQGSMDGWRSALRAAETERDASRARVQALEAQVVKLNDAIVAANEEVTALNQRLADTHTAAGKAEQSAQTATKHSEETAAALTEAQHRASTAETRLSELEGRLSETETTLSAEKQRADDAVSRTTELTHSLTESQRATVAADARATQAEQMLEALKDADDGDRLRLRLESVLQQLGSATQAAEDAQRRATVAETALKEATAVPPQHASQLEQAQSKVTDLSAQLLSAQRDVTAQSQRADRAEAECAAATSRLSALSADLSAAQKTASDAVTAAETAKKQTDDAERRLSEVETQASAAQTAASMEMKGHQDVLEEVRRSVHAANARADTAEAALQALNSVHTAGAAAASAAGATKEVQQLARDLVDARTAAATATAEVDAANTRAAAAEMALGECKKELEECKGQLDDCRRRAEAAETAAQTAALTTQSTPPVSVQPVSASASALTPTPAPPGPAPPLPPSSSSSSSASASTPPEDTARLLAATAEVGKLQERVDQLQRQLRDATDRHGRTEVEDRRECDHLRQQLDSSRQAQTALSTEIAVLKSEVEQRRKEEHDRRERDTEDRQTAKDTAAPPSPPSRSVAATSVSDDDQRQRLEAAERDVNRLKTELMEAGTNVAAEQTAKFEANAAVASLNHQLQSVTDRLTEATHARHAAAQRLDAARTEISGLKSSLKAASDRETALRTEVDALRSASVAPAQPAQPPLPSASPSARLLSSASPGNPFTSASSVLSSVGAVTASAESVGDLSVVRERDEAVTALAKLQRTNQQLKTDLAVLRSSVSMSAVSDRDRVAPLLDQLAAATRQAEDASERALAAEQQLATLRSQRVPSPSPSPSPSATPVDDTRSVAETARLKERVEQLQKQLRDAVEQNDSLIEVSREEETRLVSELGQVEEARAAVVDEVVSLRHELAATRDQLSSLRDEQARQRLVSPVHRYGIQSVGDVTPSSPSQTSSPPPPPPPPPPQQQRPHPPSASDVAPASRSMDATVAALLSHNAELQATVSRLSTQSVVASPVARPPPPHGQSDSVVSYQHHQEHAARLEGRLSAVLADNVGLQETVTRLRGDLASAQRRVADEQRANANVVADGHDRQTRLDSLVAQMAESVQARDSLARELESVKGQLVAAQQEAQHASAAATRASDRHQEAQSELTATRQRFQTTQDDLTSARDRLVGLEATVAASEQTIKELRETVSTLRQQLSDASRTAVEHGRELDAVQRASDETAATLSVVRRERDELMQQLEAARVEVRTMKELGPQLDQAVHDKTATDRLLAEVQDQLQSTRTMSDLRDEDHARAVQRYDRLVNELKQQRDKATSDATRSRDEAAQVHRHLEEARVSRDDALAAKSALESQIRSVSDSRDKALSDKAGVRRELEEAERQVHRLEVEAQRSTGMMEELHIQLKLARDGTQTAMSTRDAAVRDVDRCRADLADAHQRIANIEDSEKSVRAQLAAAQERWAAAEGSFHAARDNCATANRRVAEAATREAALKGELSAARTKCRRLEEAAATSHTAHTQATDEWESERAALTAAVDTVSAKLKDMQQSFLEAQKLMDEERSRANGLDIQLTDLKAAASRERDGWETTLTDLQHSADQRASELGRQASDAQSALSAAQTTIATQSAKVEELSAALESAKDVADQWAAHSNALQTRIERTTQRSDALASTAGQISEQMDVLQSRLSESEAREEELRFEVAELKGELFAARSDADRHRAEDDAMVRGSRNASAAVERELQLQVDDYEHQLTSMRQIEITLRAEMESLRTDLRTANDSAAVASQQLDAMRERATATSLSSSSLQSLQERSAQQLKLVTAQLQLSNKQRDALARELDDVSGVVVRLETQLDDVQRRYPDVVLRRR